MHVRDAPHVEIEHGPDFEALGVGGTFRGHDGQLKMVEALNAWERWEMPPAIVLDLFLLALDHPERVERLMALDNAPPWRDAIHPRVGALALPVLGSYQAVLATPFLGRRVLTTIGHFVRAMIRGASGPRKRWSDRELDAYSEGSQAVVASAREHILLPDVPQARARRSGARGDRTRDLRVPALLAMGSASPLRRAFVPRQRQGLRVVTIPSAGHFLPEEAPGEVFKVAKGWLEESSGSDRRRRSRVARTTTPTRR